jgi:hypothetical protein
MKLQHLTFRGPYIVMYCYNDSQQDALFLKFILIKNSTCFGQVHCPSSGVSQHCIQAIGVRHASYVGSLLARLGWNSAVYSVETPDDGQ